MATKPVRVEKAWVVACLVTVLVWSGPCITSSVNGGYGIVRRRGEIVLLHGRGAKGIDQTFGQVVWWAQELGLVLVVVCGGLGL